MDHEGRWKAVLIGGLITGLGPFVPVVNLLCCLFPLVGGLVAVLIYRGSKPPTLTNNDGVVLGALSGVAGAIIYAILLIPLAFFVSNTIGGFIGRVLPGITELPPALSAIFESIRSNLGNVVAVIVLFKIIGHLALSLAFGIIGGLIGVAIHNRKPAPSI